MRESSQWLPCLRSAGGEGGKNLSPKLACVCVMRSGLSGLAFARSVVGGAWRRKSETGWGCGGEPPSPPLARGCVTTETEPGFRSHQPTYSGRRSASVQAKQAGKSLSLTETDERTDRSTDARTDLLFSLMPSAFSDTQTRREEGRKRRKEHERTNSRLGTGTEEEQTFRQNIDAQTYIHIRKKTKQTAPRIGKDSPRRQPSPGPPRDIRGPLFFPRLGPTRCPLGRRHFSPT